jgi:hypothetical protein
MSKRVFVCVCVCVCVRERERERELGQNRAWYISRQSRHFKIERFQVEIHEFYFFTVMLNIVMLCPEACSIKLIMAVIFDIS